MANQPSKQLVPCQLQVQAFRTISKNSRTEIGHGPQAIGTLGGSGILHHYTPALIIHIHQGKSPFG